MTQSEGLLIVKQGKNRNWSKMRSQLLMNDCDGLAIEARLSCLPPDFDTKRCCQKESSGNMCWSTRNKSAFMKVATFGATLNHTEGEGLYFAKVKMFFNQLFFSLQKIMGLFALQRCQTFQKRFLSPGGLPTNQGHLAYFKDDNSKVTFRTLFKYSDNYYFLNELFSV